MAEAQSGRAREPAGERGPASKASCEILVIGGGFAGAAASITAARLGLDTVLIQSDLPLPACPADIVPAGFADTLARLGIRSAGLCRTGRMLGGRGGNATVQYIDRRAVGRALLRTAGRAGVRIRREAPEAVLTEDGRTTGLRFSGGAALRSKVLIDATGSAGWLRHRLDLRRIALSDPMIAVRGQVRGQLPALGDDGVAFTPEPHGWSALVAHGGLISWTSLCSDGRRPGRPAAIAAMPETIEETHASVGWQLIRPLAGPGWLVTGEAAGRVDPAAGSGIVDALAGGARAAHAAALCLAEPAAAAAAQHAYDRWYAELITERAAELTRRYVTHGIRLDRHQMRSDAA
jgi:flavin-dependent dehydrogenase